MNLLYDAVIKSDINALNHSLIMNPNAINYFYDGKTILMVSLDLPSPSLSIIWLILQKMTREMINHELNGETVLTKILKKPANYDEYFMSIIKDMLVSGVDPTLGTPNALHYAASTFNSSKMIHLLFAHCTKSNILVNAKDRNGNTPLMVASKICNYEAIETILTYKDNLMINFALENNDDHNVYTIASTPKMKRMLESAYGPFKKFNVEELYKLVDELESKVNEIRNYFK